jgi:hypothetical protein
MVHTAYDCRNELLYVVCCASTAEMNCLCVVVQCLCRPAYVQHCRNEWNGAHQTMNCCVLCVVPHQHDCRNELLCVVCCAVSVNGAHQTMSSTAEMNCCVLRVVQCVWMVHTRLCPALQKWIVVCCVLCSVCEWCTLDYDQHCRNGLLCVVCCAVCVNGAHQTMTSTAEMNFCVLCVVQCLWMVHTRLWPALQKWIFVCCVLCSVCEWCTPDYDQHCRS